LETSLKKSEDQCKQLESRIEARDAEMKNLLEKQGQVKYVSQTISGIWCQTSRNCQWYTFLCFLPNWDTHHI